MNEVARISKILRTQLKLKGWRPLAKQDDIKSVWRLRGHALLVDGSESMFDIYEGTVDWDGKMRRIPVDEAKTVPLVGMSLLEGYELSVQVRRAGSVTVRAMSQARSG